MAAPELPPVRPELDGLIDAALKTGGETDRFDFKELLDLSLDEHKIRLIKAVGAFSNTDEGGFLLVGISDDRRIVGLTDDLADSFDQTRVHAICAQYLAPPPVIQVRQHVFQGKRIVVLEISSFLDVPSIVRQSATFGKERALAGTFLFRSRAAKSGVLDSEADVRALCDVLVKRRASAFLELIQRGNLSRPFEAPGDRFTADKEIRHRADQLWPPTGAAQSSIEVSFVPAQPLALSPEQMRHIIPGACVQTRHGFPFWDLDGHEVQRPVSWGWYGRIPFAALEAPLPPPSYLWLLARSGAFLHREHLWEDSAGSAIPNGVGIFHVAGNIILILKFLDAVSSKLGLSDSAAFRVGVAANNVEGRYLEDEKSGWPVPYRRKAAEAVVRAASDVQLMDIRRRAMTVAVEVMEEIAWQFGRDDLRRQNIEEVIRRAPDHLGPVYKLNS